jgi:hypothetical protein
VLIGVCLKILLKKADYGEVFHETNWALAIGISTEFVLANYFVYIHTSSQLKKKKKQQRQHNKEERGGEPKFLFFFSDAKSAKSCFAALGSKVLSVCLLFGLAYMTLRPYPMLVGVHKEKEIERHTYTLLTSICNVICYVVAMRLKYSGLLLPLPPTLLKWFLTLFIPINIYIYILQYIKNIHRCTLI